MSLGADIEGYLQFVQPAGRGQPERTHTRGNEDWSEHE